MPSTATAAVFQTAGSWLLPRLAFHIDEIEPTKEGSYVAIIFKTMEDILSGMLALRGSII